MNKDWREGGWGERKRGIEWRDKQQAMEECLGYAVMKGGGGGVRCYNIGYNMGRGSTA